MVCFNKMYEMKYGQTFGIDEVTSLSFKFVLYENEKFKKAKKKEFVFTC